MTSRYECKYLIPESVALRVRADLVPFVRPDPHATGRPGGRYPISSLYLDSEDLSLYRTTIEGNRSRFKLRVRSYTDAEDAPVVLEIKRRNNGVVRKQRCAIPRAGLAAALAGDTGLAAALPADRAGLLQEFIALMLAHRARPRVVVRYDREAYVGRDGGGVRATFDRQLRALPCDRPEVPIAAGGFVPVQHGMTLLELKFDDRCPTWLLRLVQRHELRRTSFSKYCHAVRSTLRFLPHLAH